MKGTSASEQLDSPRLEHMSVFVVGEDVLCARYVSFLLTSCIARPVRSEQVVDCAQASVITSFF